MQSEIYVSVLADLRSTSNYSDTGYDSKGIPKMVSSRLFMHVYEKGRERERQRERDGGDGGLEEDVKGLLREKVWTGRNKGADD